jgi:hypothetical protein
MLKKYFNLINIEENARRWTGRLVPLPATGDWDHEVAGSHSVRKGNWPPFNELNG